MKRAAAFLVLAAALLFCLESRQPAMLAAAMASGSASDALLRSGVRMRRAAGVALAVLGLALVTAVIGPLVWSRPSAGGSP